MHQGLLGAGSSQQKALPPFVSAGSLHQRRQCAPSTKVHLVTCTVAAHAPCFHLSRTRGCQLAHFIYFIASLSDQKLQPFQTFQNQQLW